MFSTNGAEIVWIFLCEENVFLTYSEIIHCSFTDIRHWELCSAKQQKISIWE